MAETIGDVVVNVKADASGLGEEAAKKTSDQMGGAGKKSGSKFSAWFKKTAKRAFKVGAVAVGATAGAAILGGVKSAVGQQKSEKILAGLYGSGKEASSMMKELNKIASKSPLRVSTFSKGAETLAYAGIKGNDAARALENVGKAVIASGGGAEQFQGAMGGVVDMVNRGKVDLLNLNRISNAGVPILSGLADHFGVSMEKVNEMASSGKIKLEDVMAVMKEGKGVTFQDMIKGADSAAGAVGMQFQIMWGNIQDTIGQRLVPLLEKLSPIIQHVVDGAVPAVNALFDWFEKLGDVILKVFTFIGQHKTAFTVLASVIGAVAVAIGGVVLATKAWALASTLVNKAMKANIFVKIITILFAVGAAFVALYNKSETFRNIVDGAMSAVKTAFDAFWTVAQPIFQKIGDWLGTVIPPIIEWFKNAFTVAWNAISTAFSAAWDFIQPILSTLFTWIGDRLPAVFSVLKTVAKIYFLPLRLAFELLWEVAKVVFTAIKAIIENVVAPIFKWLWSAVVKPIFGFIGTFIKTTWDGIIKPVFTAIKKVIETVVAPVIKWLYNNIVKPIWQAIAKFIDTMWKGGIKVTFKAIGTFLKDILSVAFKAFQNLVKIVWNAIKSAINVVWVFIRDKVFKPIKTWVSKTITGAFKLMKTLVTNYMNGWKLIIRTVWNFVKDRVFTPIKNWVTKTIPAGFKTMKNFVTTRMNQFKTAIHTPFTWVRDKAFTPLKNLITKTVPNAFKTGVRSIKTQWGKIKGAFKTPINAVIGAYNKSVPKLWNPIAGIIGKNNWKLKNVPTFRTGGKVWGEGTETSDSILARLSKNEHVLTAADVRNMGGHENVYRMRAAAARGRLDNDMPGFAKGGPVWKNLWAINKGQFPNSRLTSAQRNSTTVSGNKSMHAAGMAIDVAGPRPMDKGAMMRMAKWWRAEYGAKLAELIHTPMGNKQIKNGRNHTYGGAVAAQHYDHVHVAARKALSGKGGLGGFASMIPGLSDLLNLKKKFKNLGSGKVGKVMAGMGKKMIDGLKDKAVSLFDFAGDVVGGAADWANQKSAQAQVRAVASAPPYFTWGMGKQWDALKWIIGKESSWNPKAANPSSSARGLFQKMTSIHGPIEKTAAGQAVWGLKYIKNRYKDPIGAKRFWQSHHWYKHGGAVLDNIAPRVLHRDRGGNVPPGTHLIHNGHNSDEYVLPPRATKALTNGSLGSGDGGEINIEVNLNISDVADIGDAVDFVKKLQKQTKNSRVRARMTAKSGEVNA